LNVEKLYDEYGFYIHRRCKSFLGNEDDARDAMHEVFLRLIRHADRLGDEPALPWLNRVTTNYCLNQLRNRRSRATDAAPDLDAVPADDARWFQTLLERRDLVARLLAQTSGQMEAIVVGYFFDEMSVERLAESLGVSVPTIRRRLKEFIVGGREMLLRDRRRATAGTHGPREA
jgi:RNA polymerase sigma-70 factor (ECF subfamily)